MRILAGIMIVIVLLVGAFFGYAYYGAQMQIEAVYAQVTPATEALGTYNETLSQIYNGSFYGTQYREVEFAGAEEYAFLTLTVRMQNRGPFPMEYIQIAVTPGTLDIVQLPTDRTPSLAANSKADFSTVILTQAGASSNRQVTVTYYVLGQKQTATYAMTAEGQ